MTTAAELRDERAEVQRLLVAGTDATLAAEAGAMKAIAEAIEGLPLRTKITVLTWAMSRSIQCEESRPATTINEPKKE